MKKLTLTYNPRHRFKKVCFTFDKDSLMVETNEPMPDQEMKNEKITSDYQYLYSKEFPLLDSLKSIREQFEQVDFKALFFEEQEFNERTLQSHSLIMDWGFHGASITIKSIDCCISHEAKRLYDLVISLFSEVGLENWYVSK